MGPAAQRADAGPVTDSAGRRADPDVVVAAFPAHDWAERQDAGTDHGFARRLAGMVRLEDWLLLGFVVFGAPLIEGSGTSDPFGGGRPVQGLLRLGAVLAALACVAARRAARASGLPQGGLTQTGALGPFTGALLLLGISGASALSLSSQAGEAFVVGAAVVMLATRLVVPPLPDAVRRALMTPFVLVAGGLFWGLIRAVFSGPLLAGPVDRQALQSLVASPAFAFLVAFSAVYYAMLIYAPRQVAEKEGSPLAWVVRYLVFLIGVTLGIGWLGALAG